MAYFEVLSQHSSGGPEESHSKLQDGLRPGRGSNAGPPEYEAGLLITDGSCYAGWARL